jgi:hypothetical protein
MFIQVVSIHVDVDLQASVEIDTDSAVASGWC